MADPGCKACTPDHPFTIDGVGCMTAVWPVFPTTTPYSARRRNAGLLTLAGVVTGLPAAGALVTRTLDTPLTIGGPETVEIESVDEQIVFNPKTGSIVTLRGEEPTLAGATSGQLLLFTSTLDGVDDKPLLAMIGINTRFLVNTDPSFPPGSAGLLPERLSQPGPIGPASNWGNSKPGPVESGYQPASIGIALPAFPIWSEGSRGYLGFEMDGLEPTGNQIYYQTSPSSWADPAVPEYETVLKPEYTASNSELYGWADIGHDADGYTLYGYAYEDSGAAISAVPEPSGSLALASLLGGSLLLRSRRKAQGSVADV